MTCPLSPLRSDKHCSGSQRPDQKSDRGRDETAQRVGAGAARPEGGSHGLLLPADQLPGQHHQVSVPDPPLRLSRLLRHPDPLSPPPRPRRYLDSCNIPNTVKRKCGSSSCTSTSDEDRQQEANGNKGAFTRDGKLETLHDVHKRLLSTLYLRWRHLVDDKIPAVLTLCSRLRRRVGGSRGRAAVPASADNGHQGGERGFHHLAVQLQQHHRARGGQEAS